MPEPLTDAQKVVRNDTGKRIAKALESLASEVTPSGVIAPEYDETQTYAVGDLVIYRSVLYRCTTAITTPEEWTAAHWTAVTVADELADKYVKPAGGIPKNDLAASVQESLDKADTALQQHQSLDAYRTAAAQDAIDANLMALGLTGASAGDMVRVAAVDANGKPTSWNHVPLCDIATNKNLLDNWYFIGGGSQNGDGVFPINQRGHGQYSNAGYGIDRWWWWTTTNYTLNAAGLALGAGNYIVQKINHALSANLAGKVVTMSCLMANNILLSKTFEWNLANAEEINSDGVTIIAGGASPGFSINFPIFLIQTNQETKIIKTVKLELGSEQTLAHNEGTEESPVWVLNEIPDYGQELAKCQRYYQLFRTESLRPTYGEDCRPTMATEQPTKGTLTKNGVTYYTLSSEL